MRRNTPSDVNFDKSHRTTRKEAFLAKMDGRTHLPWQELRELIEPYYPKVRGARRRPMEVERMLRAYLCRAFGISLN